MIMLNTVDARALLDLFNGKTPDRDQLTVLAGLHQKLRNHEGLIAQCEAARPKTQPFDKEPA